ncbi:hypothetical protein B0H10DRAFT_1946320 [Mycena sp. CBHHK59/15]|nr:hypothetical protein B0H10DRAFT_1946320 [Mycena sp. CBHHK59/15]
MTKLNKLAIREIKHLKSGTPEKIAIVIREKEVQHVPQFVAIDAWEPPEAFTKETHIQLKDAWNTLMSCCTNGQHTVEAQEASQALNICKASSAAAEMASHLQAHIAPATTKFVHLSQVQAYIRKQQFAWWLQAKCCKSILLVFLGAMSLAANLPHKRRPLDSFHRLLGHLKRSGQLAILLLLEAKHSLMGNVSWFSVYLWHLSKGTTNYLQILCTISRYGEHKPMLPGATTQLLSPPTKATRCYQTLAGSYQELPVEGLVYETTPATDTTECN